MGKGVLLGFCFLSPRAVVPTSSRAPVPWGRIVPLMPGGLPSFGISGLCVRHLGLLVRVPLQFSWATKGLGSFTEASVLLCKVPLMLSISCLPSQVLVTFDHVLLIPSGVSLLYYFSLNGNGLFCYRAAVQLDRRPHPHPLLPPPVVHDRKIQLPAGKRVSYSRLCASHSGSKTMTTQGRLGTGLRFTTEVTGS